MESLYLVGVGVLALFAFVLAIIFFKFFTTWLRARVANAPVSIGKMIGMSLRKVPVGLIVDNRITAVKTGIDISSHPPQAPYFAGRGRNNVHSSVVPREQGGASPPFYL